MKPPHLTTVWDDVLIGTLHALSLKCNALYCLS